MHISLSRERYSWYLVFQSHGNDPEFPPHSSSHPGIISTLWLKQERKEMVVSSHYLLTGLFPPILQSLHASLWPNLRASAPQLNPLLRAQWLPHLLFEFLNQRKAWLVFWELTWVLGAHSILGREGLQKTQLWSKGNMTWYFSFIVAPQRLEVND